MLLTIQQKKSDTHNRLITKKQNFNNVSKIGPLFIMWIQDQIYYQQLVKNMFIFKIKINYKSNTIVLSIHDYKKGVYIKHTLM